MLKVPKKYVNVIVLTGAGAQAFRLVRTKEHLLRWFISGQGQVSCGLDTILLSKDLKRALQSEFPPLSTPANNVDLSWGR